MARRKRVRRTVDGYAPSANPEQAHWMRELAKSNAAQPHVPQPRKGTRAELARRAIRDEREGS